MPKDALYLDPQQPIPERVSDLLSRMTLEEKVGQMCQYLLPKDMLISNGEAVNPSLLDDNDDSSMRYSASTQRTVPQLIRQGLIGSILSEVDPERLHAAQMLALQSRLSIPLLFGIDAIHGNAMQSGCSVFPAPISLAATFDVSIVIRVAQATAREMRSRGLHWTFSPNVDVMRDGRWGRVGETSGEDPYVVGQMGIAMIRGYQGDFSDPHRHVLACAKHYIAGGEPSNGRNFAAMDMSERALREVYLPPFIDAVRAGVGTVMAAHNEVNGVPCHGNRALLTDVLRDELGFEGFIVSDFTDVHRLYTLHRVATSVKDADRLAVWAGIDMHMHGPGFHTEVCQLVREGIIMEACINTAVSKILTAKFQLHLFEKPFADPRAKLSMTTKEEHKHLALETARKSIVLLKNDTQLLPLNRKISQIFITGPNANSQAILGDWSVIQPHDNVITILQGIQTLADPDCTVDYLDCGGVLADMQHLTQEAEKRALDADVAIVVVGENPLRTTADKTEGENVARTNLDLPGNQMTLVKAVIHSGTPTIVILVNGRPLAVPWIAEHAHAILEAFHPGMLGGQATAEVLFGMVNPGGRLPYTIPYSVGHLRMIYNQRPSDTFRTYPHDVNEPLYPFGYGLSYTTFTYSNIQVPEDAIIGEDVILSMTVTNSGSRKGDEVIIVYGRDLFATVTRPVKEVMAFSRVSLDLQETRTLNFILKADQFGLFDTSMHRVIEPGLFEISIGEHTVSLELVESTDSG